MNCFLLEDPFYGEGSFHHQAWPWATDLDSLRIGLTLFLPSVSCLLPCFVPSDP